MKKIYLDILRDKLTCEVKLIYNSTEINLLSNDSSISRDDDYEGEITEDLINARFNINKDKKLTIRTIYHKSIPQFTTKKVRFKNS